ncbi:MAG: TolC family protein [Bacteroidota bacterium]
MKKIIFIAVLLTSFGNSYAQQAWSLETVLQRVMQQNERIDIAKRQTLLEEQKITKGMAGLTPVVRAFAGGEYTQSNIALEINTFGQGGQETQKITDDLAGSMSHNAGVQLDYVLYDGGRGKKVLQQLRNTANLAALRQQLTIDNTLLQVTQLYLNIASREQTVQLLKENIKLSQQRIDRAVLNDKYAKGNALSVLQAKTDLNSDSIALKNLQRELQNTQRDLLRTLNIDEDSSFETLPLVSPNSLPSLESLKTSAQQKNPEILLAEQGIIIDQQQLAIAETTNKPTIQVYGLAGYGRQDYEANQIKFFQSIDLTAGFSVSYNLYDGHKRRREQDIQRLQIRISEKEKDLVTKDVFTALDKGWNTYQNLEEQLTFEQKNLPFYTENLSRVQTNYKNGKATDTDIRTAQLGLLSAQISIARKKIELQTQYFTLLKLAGLITT